MSEYRQLNSVVVQEQSGTETKENTKGNDHHDKDTSVTRFVVTWLDVTFLRFM